MNWKDKLKAFLKALPIWLALLGPVLLLASMIITAMLDFRFFHMEAYWEVVLLGLLPTIVLAILYVVRLFVKVCYRVFVAFALLGLLYFIPIGMLFTALSMDFYSETEDIAHYRQLDELFSGMKRRKPSFRPKLARMGGTTIIATMITNRSYMQNGRSRRRSWRQRSSVQR